MRVPYYGSRSEHLDDAPLDLTPRRLIAPRRRIRELSTDHTIFRTHNLLVNNEVAGDSLNRVLTALHARNSDFEQPESPPVIIYISDNYISSL